MKSFDKKLAKQALRTLKVMDAHKAGTSVDESIQNSINSGDLVVQKFIRLVLSKSIEIGKRDKLHKTENQAESQDNLNIIKNIAGQTSQELFAVIDEKLTQNGLTPDTVITPPIGPEGLAEALFEVLTHVRNIHKTSQILH